MIVTCTLKRVVTETCQIEIVVPDIPAGSRYLQQLEEVYEFAAKPKVAREGDKVTVMYRMTATSIEAKSGAAKKGSKPK